MDERDRPDEAGDDEELQQMGEALREFFDLLDSVVTDEVLDEMVRRDLGSANRLAEPQDDGGVCADAPGADAVGSAGVQDVAHALSITRAAQRTAQRVVDEARRKGDEIIAAARAVATAYTDDAIARAARTVGCASTVPLPARSAAADVTQAQTADADRVPDEADNWGQAWLAALSDSGVYIAAEPAAVTHTLSRYLQRLREAAASPADIVVARRVGQEILALGVNQPAAFGATVAVVGPMLVDRLGDGGTVMQVLAALAEGYAAALRDDVLAQQNAVQVATQAAARQIEVSMRASEVRYRQLALYDALTGLPNRTLLAQRLRQLATRQGRARQVGLCLIDVVGFKKVNDEHRVNVGNQVLTVIAHRLQRFTEHGDSLLARLGSDEFVIVVDDSAGAAHMVDLAEQVVALFAEPIVVADRRVQLAVRVGIVDIRAADMDPAQILIDAEAAVRQAKDRQRPWAIHEARPAPAPLTTDIRPDSRGAPDLDPVPLAYEPIIGIRDGRIRGLQAVVRWQHPHLGTLDLRRIGDLTGSRATVTRLATEALHQVCQHAMQASGLADAPYVGINLPLHQIGFPDIIDVVRQALNTSGLPPGRLQLQLSEIDAVALPAGHHDTTVLNSLAHLGVGIAIDDFGTGYTNLGYLRHLPIGELRTPASILSTHPATESIDRALLTAMVNVAHAVDLTITVHGLDTDHHAGLVAAAGSDAGQGRYFAAPMSIEQATVLITETDTTPPPNPLLQARPTFTHRPPVAGPPLLNAFGTRQNRLETGPAY